VCSENFRRKKNSAKQNIYNQQRKKVFLLKRIIYLFNIKYNFI
jgi:hypothetical protein